MGLEVGSVRGGILVEARGLDDVFEHAAHVAIHILDVELAFFHTLDDLLYLSGLSGLHEVVAGLHFTDGGQTCADANPVGHHDAFKAPVLTQDLRQQVVVAHRELAVHLIIGGHDGPGVALADGNLEATEVELTGGTLRDALVDTGTIRLLRVDGEVLGRDACSLALHALDIGGGNLSCEEGILGVILEVTSAEGIAVEVHTWAENHVAAVFLGLVADGFTNLAHELGVPCGSETGADGEGGGVVGLVGTLARGVDTDTGRAVGEYGGRDAETGDGRRCTCGSCHEVGLAAYNGTCAEEVVCTSHEEFCLLLKGHCL